MDPERSLCIEINEKPKNDVGLSQEKWSKWSIYKVPPYISELNPKAYKPKAVSFGPYYHGNKDLQAMEDDKQRAVLYFFNRYARSRGLIVESLRHVVDELQDSYASLEPQWKCDKEAFVDMMVKDGCFMLEILRAFKEKSEDLDYAKGDPIFGYHGKLSVMPFIRRDMLLLENQLPMLVLIRLLGFKENKKDLDQLNKDILTFCSGRADLPNMGKCLHVLDLHRKSLLQKSPLQKSPTTCWWSTPKSKENVFAQDEDSIDNPILLRSATELQEAGIQFKASRTRFLNDISFNEKFGILYLPMFVVDDTTESTFLNLIAFERCHVGLGYEVTSFICFMDNIIDIARDITTLSSPKIIQNIVGSDEAAAVMFNRIAKEVKMDPNSDLTQVHRSVVKYCGKMWPKQIANLRHTYFRSPWASVSVFAAIFLFSLTILQTIYTLLDYYNN